MKQFFLATLVGGLLVFVLQALSWMALPIHQDALRYTPAQDSLLALLDRNIEQDGLYALPSLPPGLSHDSAEHQKLYDSMIGKPWALLQYHRSFNGMSGFGMLHGFLLDLLAVALVVWLLRQAGDRLPNFRSRFLAVLAFAGVILLQAEFMDMNWWNTPWHYIQGQVIDRLLAWGVCGAWLAWYLGRK